MYSKSTLKIQNPDAIIRRFPRPLKQESGYFPPTLFQSLKKQLKHCFTLFDRGVGWGGGVGLGGGKSGYTFAFPLPTTTTTTTTFLENIYTSPRIILNSSILNGETL